MQRNFLKVSFLQLVIATATKNVSTGSRIVFLGQACSQKKKKEKKKVSSYHHYSEVMRKEKCSGDFNFTWAPSIKTLDWEKQKQMILNTLFAKFKRKKWWKPLKIKQNGNIMWNSFRPKNESYKFNIDS